MLKKMFGKKQVPENEDMEFEKILDECWTGKAVKTKSRYSNYLGKPVPTYFIQSGRRRLDVWSYKSREDFDIEIALDKISDKLIKGEKRGVIRVKWQEIAWQLI